MASEDTARHHRPGVPVDRPVNHDSARPGPTASLDRRFDLVVGALVALGVAVICAMAIVRRPDINASVSFVFSDPGVNLLLAERLAEGARLYRDLGYSYGPLAIHPYAGFASLFGNTPQAYMAFLAMFSTINVALAYGVLRTRVSRRTAVIATIAGLYPTMVLPGSMVFGIHSSSYFVIERTLFLVLLLCWRPPHRKTAAQAIAVGAILGISQGVRFGTALFLGAAIVVVDLLALHATRMDRAGALRWLRLSFITLGAFLLVELVWVVYAMTTLPRSAALDFLWPAYVLEAFRAFEAADAGLRWPRFIGMRMFLGHQLVVIASAMLAVGGAIMCVRRLRRSDEPRGQGSGADDLRLVIPLAFYALGASGLFQWEYHFRQYAWTLVIAAALMLEWARTSRIAYAIVAAPALVLLLRVNLIAGPPSGLVDVRAPAGGYVVVDSATARTIGHLRAFATDSGGRALIILRNGGGFHALFGVPFTGRQSFYLLGFAREGDEARTLRTLDAGSAAIVLTEYLDPAGPASDPCTWYGFPHFRREFCGELGRRIDLRDAVRLDATTWLVPVGRRN